MNVCRSCRRDLPPLVLPPAMMADPVFDTGSEEVEKGSTAFLKFGSYSCLGLLLLVAIIGPKGPSTAAAKAASVSGSQASTMPPPSVSPKRDQLVVRVTGAEGVRFEGSYVTVETWGMSASKSVVGTVPATYPVNGMTVSTFFQNKGNAGPLRVEILQDESVIKSSETNAPYGAVTLATE